MVVPLGYHRGTPTHLRLQSNTPDVSRTKLSGPFSGFPVCRGASVGKLSRTGSGPSICGQGAGRETQETLPRTPYMQGRSITVQGPKAKLRGLPPDSLLLRTLHHGARAGRKTQGTFPQTSYL
jgi:hypothetical protein